MSIPIRLLLTAFLPAILAAPTLVRSAETPAMPQAVGWRGDGTGLYPGVHPPVEWDSVSGKNILWRTKVGKGRSTPVVAAGRIFITAEPESLLCLDRAGGNLLWTRDNGYGSLPPDIKAPGERPPTSPDCGYAAPTPVVAGGRVYAVFGSGIIVCYDFQGNRQWIRLIDVRQITEYGRSVSPLLAGDRLLVSLAGLTALDPKTGVTLWDAPAAKSSYGTPALMKLGDVELAITPHGDCVRVSDGRILATKLARMKYVSPLVVDNVVYFADAATMAYKLTLQPDGTLKSAKLWESQDVDGEFFASPVCHDGVLYLASNSGILYALNASTGQLRWTHELGIRCSAVKVGDPANIYPSLTLLGKNLCVSNDAGEMVFLKPGRQYEQVARTSLGSGSGATPVPDGANLLLRGEAMLYCVGSRAP